MGRPFLAADSARLTTVTVRERRSLRLAGLPARHYPRRQQSHHRFNQHFLVPLATSGEFIHRRVLDIELCPLGIIRPQFWPAGSRSTFDCC
jgi:hypothetical protein